MPYIDGYALVEASLSLSGYTNIPPKLERGIDTLLGRSVALSFL